MNILWKLLFFSLLVSVSVAQSAWDSGSFDATYGSPFPNESWSVEGAFLNEGIPAQGVGGFSLDQAGDHYLFGLAYETYIIAEDTLADAFLMIMTDSVAITTGSYDVSIDPAALRLFVWFEEVDPELVMGMLDTSFTIDSLDAFDPFISLSGTIDISELGFSGFSASLSAMMVTPGLNIRILSSASLVMENTFPMPIFSLGSLSATSDGLESDISGDLNPLIDSDGVGALFLQTGDTLSYTMLAYEDQGDNAFDVYGVQVTGLQSDFGETETEFTIPLTIDPGTLPRATPMLIRDVSLDSLAMLLQSGDLSGLSELDDVFLPMWVGDCIFSRNAEQSLELSFPNFLMANSNGATMLLSEVWFVSNQWPVATHETAILPENELAVGAPYPNPFNSATVIPIDLKHSQYLELVITNILGQEKMRLNLGQFSAGSHRIRLDLASQSLPGGFYSFQITTAENHIETGSFLYLK